MSTEIAQKVRTAETLFLSMFPEESGEEFRRFLLFAVYKTIQNQNNITVNKLKWKLNRELAFKDHDIDIAVSALSNPNIFNALSNFHVPKRKIRDAEKEVVHLRLRKDCQDLIEHWANELLQSYPEYSTVASA